MTTPPTPPEPVTNGGKRDTPAPSPPGQSAQVVRFTSREEEEVGAFIADHYIGNDSRFGGATGRGARFEAATVITPQIHGGLIRSTIDYGGTSDPFDYPLFYVCVNGSVSVDGVDGVTQRLRPGDASFFAPGTPLDFDFHDIGFQLLALPPGQLEQVAEEVTDVPAARVRLDGDEPVSAAAHQRWVDTFAYIRRTLDRSVTSPTSPSLTHQLARLLAVTALETFPNTTMGRHLDAGPGRVAPAATRRAAAYVEAHAHEPVQLAEMAAAAGTSPRALQYGFRRHLGATPMGYLRQVRLQRAHRELQAADPTSGVTVAAVAARWGFATPGRFTTAYRAAYGQPPSQTLRS